MPQTTTGKTSKKGVKHPVQEMRTDWRLLFLEALRNRPNVAQAAKAAGVDRSTAYRQRDLAPEFAVEWDKAIKVGVGALEDTAYERAFSGSDTLVIFLLKAHDPKYRDRQEITFKREQLAKLTDEELIALAEGKQP